jgi:hypothetical protein
MILFYSDSDIIDREWLSLLRFSQPTQISHSYLEYQQTPADYKIAFTSHRLHSNHDIKCTAYNGFEEKIKLLSESSNLVFSLESELHNFHWSIWHYCHRENVYWLQPGAVNDRDDMNSHIIYWGDFFKLVAKMYKELPHKLALLNDPYQPKARYFDALLGSPKPHRQFVFDSVAQYNLQDKFVMTYGGKWNDNEFYAKDYFLWEPDCVPQQKIIGTADYVKYDGYLTPLSHVIPTTTFNETAYSIIAETDHDNTLSFYSEKTAKALVARRLFVAFTGYKFLHNLRAIGFKTFDGIIDESYDLVKNNVERYAKAFEQVRFLCSQDQSTILEQARPILEHNYNLIMNTDWTVYSIDRVQQQINKLFVGIQDPPTDDVL